MRVVSDAMQRLCGRPGCSDAASVSYGMRAEDLVFWLDALVDDAEAGAQVLCRRHADSMVVPRGWTLDDLRDPDLHLFRPPLPAPTARTRAPRPVRERTPSEQLRLVDDDGTTEDASGSVTEMGPTRANTADVTPEDAGPWTPAFDEADDLDGLLSANSPLLSRAFRTADRRDA